MHDQRKRTCGSRVAAVALIGALITLAAGAAQAVAAPAVTVTGYKITSDMPPAGVPTDGPSPLQAGATTNAGSFSTFAYSTPTEDLKTALTNFAPGLLGNPESVPKCPEANLQAGTCPDSTIIGTARLDTVIAGTTTPAGPPAPGIVYNAQPLGTEPGRLGVRTTTAFGTLVSSIPFFLTPRGGGDYGLTGILTDINRLPSPPFPFDLQVSALGFILNGATNKYVRNPTSCGDHTSTGQAIGWDDPTAVDGPPYAFTTSGCELLGYSPSVSVQIGSVGTTKQFGYPPFTLKITQPPLQADIRDTTFTLPVELNTNSSAYKLCTQAQADADACPKESEFGSVTARSPFLAEALSGPVYLIQQTASSLPGLLLDLRGRAHVKIQTSTVLIGGKQFKSIATNTPQVPISEFTVSLNGGKSTGVFQNRYDLCFRAKSTSQFKRVTMDSRLDGWNGATSAGRLNATIAGCGPAVSPRLFSATKRRPSLRATVRRHPDSPNMKVVQLSLGKGLVLVRSRIRRGASAPGIKGVAFTYRSRRALDVVGLPSTGVRKITVRLARGAVRVSSKVRRALRRGRTRTLALRVKQTPVAGPETSTRAKFKVRGRR